LVRLLSRRYDHDGSMPSRSDSVETSGTGSALCQIVLRPFSKLCAQFQCMLGTYDTRTSTVDRNRIAAPIIAKEQTFSRRNLPPDCRDIAHVWCLREYMATCVYFSCEHTSHCLCRDSCSSLSVHAKTLQRLRQTFWARVTRQPDDAAKLT
jgi:hypothetical protein